ncbi:MAG: TIM barrel protein [Pirellulales bacterium]
MRRAHPGAGCDTRRKLIDRRAIAWQTTAACLALLLGILWSQPAAAQATKAQSTEAQAAATPAAGAQQVAERREPMTAAELFRPENLVAWCIVPFDASHRTPAERAEMLVRLGFQRVAYDWRDQHVAEFEQEIQAYQRQGLEYFAFWTEHPRATELFRQYDLHPQWWVINPSPADGTSDRVQRAADELLPMARRAIAAGCPLGLYNHGGWGGEPENLVAVCQRLRAATGSDQIGIVYNFHHAHDRIETFPQDLQLMLPYLLCVNINGMNPGAQPKILGIGQGRHELQMLRTLVSSGYRGRIGIIHHREELDAQRGLQENLSGLHKLVESGQLDP